MDDNWKYRYFHNLTKHALLFLYIFVISKGTLNLWFLNTYFLVEMYQPDSLNDIPIPIRAASASLDNLTIPWLSL